MPEFSLELYRSRTAEIVAQRAEAQAAYEAAALACAFDPSAGGQLEARALVADLDAQQEALDAAYTKFTRDSARRAAEETRAAWQADADKIDAIASGALEEVRADLEPLLPVVRTALEKYARTKSAVQVVVRGYRMPTSNWRGSWNPVWDLNKLGGPELNAVAAITDLIEAFANLERIGGDAIQYVAPELPQEEAA